MNKITFTFWKAILNVVLGLGTGAVITGAVMTGGVHPAAVLGANVAAVVMGLVFMAAYVVGSIILVAFSDSG
ncbi:hypothetical protein CGK14_20960 [Vibrio parahaemolyticus]|uniref:hypothetical protein n=1 Tax=Vibrio parahaemolyticus TaxID=670 RepID=UPI001120169A|nr:hypothetical protein [Vibrio parahaemolyticus]TOB01668.1 hypothetical protein CGK14_20960 [Vibrio parahaemolyticus]